MTDSSEMFAPKKNERLDNVINMLKDHIGFVEKNSVEHKDESKTDPETDVTNDSCMIPSGDGSLSKSYLMWQNSANSCWLDASMALLAHNRTLTQSINGSSNAQIAKIIDCYYKAIKMLNNVPDSKHIDERVQDAKEMLRTVQESVLKYLQPILKYKQGEPDSAFCSLFNIIAEDKAVKNLFQLEYTWVQKCQECNTQRPKTHRKPIITLPRVESFQPSSPIAIYQCLVCNAKDQRMMLHFRTLPQCLLFHFEYGAGKGELLYNSFKVDGRTYRMTGVMTLEKGKESNSNHFVTYIRDPPSDTWMECNDLCEDIVCFQVAPPYIRLQDVYILMFEAEGGISSVPNFSLAAEVEGLGEESSFESGDIPFIDLEDEVEENKPGDNKKKSKEFDKSVFEKKDLSKKGSIKDAAEKACSIQYDHEDVSCESTDSLQIDPAPGSCKVGLFGSDCEEDSSKHQSKYEGLLKKVNGNKYDSISLHQPMGLFAKFHLTSKDDYNKHSPEVGHGISTDNATMSGCVHAIPPESKDALLDNRTRTDIKVCKPIANTASQLHVNDIKNNSLQAEFRKSPTANVSVFKDISSSKNNMDRLDEMALSVKGIQSDADSEFVSTCAAVSSSSSKSTNCVKKKLVRKNKLVSSPKTLLRSEKPTNKMSENLFLAEIPQSQISGMQLDKITETSPTLTESKSHTSVASQGNAKPIFKSRNLKLLNNSKVENNFTKIDDNLQVNAIKVACITPETTSESSVQNSDVIKKKISEMPMVKIVNISTNRLKKQMIAKQRKAKTILKNRKQKSEDSQIVEDNSMKNGNDLQEQSIVIFNIRTINENETKLENLAASEQKLRVLSDYPSKSIKLGDVNEFNPTRNENDSQEQPILISNIKSISENGNELKNPYVPKKQLKIRSGCSANNLKSTIQHKSLNGTLSETSSEDKNFENCSMKEQPQIYESICSNDPHKTVLTAKKNKAKPMLQNKRSKLSNGLKKEKSPAPLCVALQEKANASTSMKATNEIVSTLLTPNVIGKKKIKKSSQLKKNDSCCDMNLLNDPRNTSLIVNGSRATSPKNRKRKCMDNSKGEASTTMDCNNGPENNSSNMCLDQSSKNVPPKRKKYDLRKSVSAVQQQNDTNIKMAIDTSDCNNQSVKTTLNMNEVSSTSCGSKTEPPHGPECSCVGMKMSDDLLDFVLASVLKNVFNFIGIKE